MSYCRDVQQDFKELKEIYPFSFLTIPLSCKPQAAVIRVVVANKTLVDAVRGVETDFLGDYSKELYLVVPAGYKTKGCYVYGAKWLDLTKIKHQYVHLIYDTDDPLTKYYGWKLCVGTPESFGMLHNVILENVKTADNMLIAYERIMRGKTKTLDLIAYAHGEAGRKEFKMNQDKYITKK